MITKFIKRILPIAATTSGATILGQNYHQFSPQGVSGVVLIAESHVSVHTWPEYGYAAIDIFSCGDRVNPEIAAQMLTKEFKAKTHTILEIPRGILES